ncbi:MAG: hypothetical protein IPP80_11090 [Ignavibacteria bacterium]|nr:hypothetical protein [Ignavibacteria bacterium]
MIRIVKCSALCLIWVITVADVWSQGAILQPSWKMSTGWLYDVSDSTVVTARNDSVRILDAYTGAVQRVWTVPFNIYGICLPKHKKGVTLLHVKTDTASSIVTVYDFSDDGVLERSDTLNVPINLINDKYAYRILCISQGGRFIVTESGILLNRKAKSSSRITNYNLVYASFSIDDAFASYLYGRRWVGIRGDVHDERYNSWYSVDSSTKACKFAIPSSDESMIHQFLPGTNEYLANGITYDLCSGQTITQFPMTLRGIICDNGMRTIGYEHVQDSRLSPRIHLVISDIETEEKQFIEANLYSQPMFEGRHSFKMSPSGEVVVTRDTIINVYIASKLKNEVHLSKPIKPVRYTEHTTFTPVFSPIPINAGLRIGIVFNGVPPKNGLAFLPAGTHEMRVEVSDRSGVRSTFDTTIVVDTLPSVAHALWTGRFPKSYNYDLSPSGRRIAACGEHNIIADLEGDSLFFVEKPLVDWMQSQVVSFATNDKLAFSRYTQGGEKLPGGQENWYFFERWTHRFLDVDGFHWTEVEQRFETYTPNCSKSVFFQRHIDRRHGRISLFEFTTDYVNRYQYQSELVVGEPGSSMRSGCHAYFNCVAFDPSQDNPLFVHAVTNGGVWRKNGGSGLCGDTLLIPAESMLFVNEGRYLWSGSGIFDGRTYELVRSRKLPANVQAVPHTSLVLGTKELYSNKLDSTLFIFLHSATGDTAGRTVLRGRLSRFVFDTSGSRMLVWNATDTVLHILDAKAILRTTGLDTFYVTTPLPPVAPPPDIDTAVDSIGIVSFPNPATEWAEFILSSSRTEVNDLIVYSEMGSTMLTAQLDPTSTRYRWNLRSGSNQRVAPACTASSFRTQDGRILESGTFIVAPE